MSRLLIILFIPLSLLATSVYATGDNRQEPYVAYPLPNQRVITEGSVIIDQEKINYQAETGILELNRNDPEDPVISMFYVAYFKKDADERRPITFIYNGGPGSASLWLHMAALGPKRAISTQPQATQLAPYQLTNNQYSLLNVSDLVFIDAPGTGYSQFSSHASSKTEREYQKSQSASSVYGVNGDAWAFSQFVTQFLTDYQRWNSPKYLLGESYGTTRSVVLAHELMNQAIDLNGIIMVSQLLNYDNNIDDPDLNPGIDQPYYLALPTYTATASYHNMLPNKHEDLKILLQKAEQFALGPYAQALQQGANLPEDEKLTIAEQLYQFTGISADYWVKANLRLNGPVFSKKLLSRKNETIGRIDTRYNGSSINNLTEKADYDPSSSAIIFAHVAQFHDYLRTTLKFNIDRNYQIFSDAAQNWNMSISNNARSFNVLPTLSWVMKNNPKMKVMVIGGIYDLATPYFIAKYEMSHLPVSPKLYDNISFYWYATGHMPYLDEISLKKMHADMAAFIKKRS